MTITDRDRKLIVFLPAILILVGYGLWFTWTSKGTEVKKARDEMVKAEQAAPPQERIVHEQGHVRIASLDAENAAKQVEASRKKFHESVRTADPVHRAERIHKLTTLLAAHGLHIINASAAEASGEVVSASLEAFAKQLPIPVPPKLHKIQFAGRYHDATRLTAALSRDGTVAIPVGLTMKESPNDSDWHEWVLLVWV